MPAARTTTAPVTIPMRVAAATLLCGVVAWGCFQNLYRLGSANWVGDELTYHFTGWEYVKGHFDHNFDHPFTGKLLLGAGQLLVGRGQAQSRLVPAIASLLTGLAVYALLRREAGFVAAVTALGLWLVLPHSAPELPVRIDRFGLLEPMLTLLVFGVLFAGWRWTRTGAWHWALLTGVSAGLAMTTKVTGVVVLPAVLLTALVVRRGATAWAQVIGCAIATELTAVASYAVAGARGAEAVRYMVEKQSAHRATGHLVTVAGTEYLHPPWWSHLWFQTQSYGVEVSVVLGLLALVGLFARPGGLGVYLLAGIAAPFLFLSLGAGIALPFYYLVWQPALVALAGLGAGALWRGRYLGPVLAAASLVPLITLGASTSAELGRLRHTDYDLLGATPLVQARAHPRDVVLVLGYADRVAVLLPEQPVLTRLVPGRKVAAIVVDCAFARRHPKSPVLHYVRTSAPRLARTDVDGGLVVYVAGKPDRSAPPPCTGQPRARPRLATR